MRWLFLRSAHAGECDTPAPDPILDIDNDMWCGLFAEIVKQNNGTGLIAKYGSSINFSCRDGIKTVRSVDLKSVAMEFKPCVVFDRGGYPEYIEALNSCRDAIKIYYGAGTRWLPLNGVVYDLILVDTLQQKDIVSETYPNARVFVIHKSAANCFVPVLIPRKYDLVYICNRPSESKGCKWLADRLPKWAKILCIGPENKWFPDADSTGRLDRKDIPKFACQARTGIVCDDGKYDSGPRVIPELMAMNIPVLIRDTVRTDKAFIINPCTGNICCDDNFEMKLGEMLVNLGSYSPRRWYEQNISMEKIALQILEMIK